MPSLIDWAIMSGFGLVWAGGMYFTARAYSMSPASVVAPFEYVALPINAMWGVMIWQEIPTLVSLRWCRANPPERHVYFVPRTKRALGAGGLTEPVRLD